MQLSGTIQNRTQTAIDFLKANRTKTYDRNEIANIYKKAGVPFTEAADNFFQEWYGVVENAYFYKIAKETDKFHKKGDIISIDCFFDLFDQEESIREEYEFSSVDEIEDSESLYFTAMIKKKYGEDTVPVAEGGYYYPGVIYVRPDGGLLIFHPDYDNVKPWEYNNFFELMCDELLSPAPEYVEIILQNQELSGTIMDCLYAAVRFANAHGGFKSCRLFNSFCWPWDTSQMPDDPELTDDELAKCLLQILQRQCSRPENIWPPTMIWHVLQ